MGKKIFEISLIVFSVIFVGFMATKIMGPIMAKGNSASTKMVDTLDMVDSSGIKDYSNKSVTGDKVVAAINNGKTINGSDKMAIIVKTADTTVKIYGYAKTGTTQTGTYKDASGTSKTCTWESSTVFDQTLESDSTKAGFINEGAQFYASPILNKNEVIIGLYFEQQ